jgi:adenylosuccinate lyase
MPVVHVVVDRVPSADHADAYFALAGALGGAAVTGLLGFLGLKAQSNAQKRHLEQQLDHDRDQTDLELLRSILGDAAEALGMVRAAFIRLLRFVPFGPVGQESQRRDDAMTQQRVAAAAARSALDRMRLQLPPDDEVMIAYEKVMTTLDEVATEIVERAPGYEQKIAEIDPRLEADMGDFIRRARDRVGPRARAVPAVITPPPGGP